jgi:EAL domain-containing protein (putative c-di-GMP-specific phosphodiesterase class I)
MAIDAPASSARQTAIAQLAGKRIGERLQKDLEANRFMLFSQAIVPLAPADRRATYREILIRFKDEETNMQSPGMFLPLLEEQGLMPLLDRWVVSRVLQWLRESREARGSPEAHVCSVNLSGDTMRNAAFGDHVAREIRTSAVPAPCLSFEIPIADALADSTPLPALMMTLRNAGCTFALSGFTGTNAGFELASRLGFAIVKLDGSMLDGVADDVQRQGKLDTVTRRCQRVGLRTVAMQVESEATLEALRAIQVDYVQGFGVERPHKLEF